MDCLPPIEVSRISDGGKVRSHKELFLIQSDYSVRYGFTLFKMFESSYRKKYLPLSYRTTRGSETGKITPKLEPRSLKRNPYRPRRGGLTNGGPQKFLRPS